MGRGGTKELQGLRTRCERCGLSFGNSGFHNHARSCQSSYWHSGSPGRTSTTKRREVEKYVSGLKHDPLARFSRPSRKVVQGTRPLSVPTTNVMSTPGATPTPPPSSLNNNAQPVPHSESPGIPPRAPCPPPLPLGSSSRVESSDPPPSTYTGTDDPGAALGRPPKTDDFKIESHQASLKRSQRRNTNVVD